MPKKLDFNKARTFVEVVDSGSITAAANRLLRTQQAISSQLLLLEEELGIHLFDRQGPKITLTDAGDQLYRDFRPRFTAIENSVQSLKANKASASGVIRIGAWMEQSVSYLPEMIRIFSETNPKVDFRLIVGLDEEIELKLETNALDIGFLLFPQNRKLFHSEAVYRQPLLPVVSRRYLQIHKLPKTIKDTLDTPLLDYSGEYSAYITWIRMGARELLPLAKKKNPTITVSNNVVLKQLVLQGLGFGFLHQEAIQAELDVGELIALTFSKKIKPIQVEIDMVYKRKSTLSYVHQAFVNFIRQHRKSWMI